LGYGFAEKVYENALTFEILQNGLLIEQQKPIAVYYHHNLVGEFNADLLINEVVLVELKACKQLIPEHEAQLLNYLKSTRIEVGLLLNFGPKAQYLRKVFDNERKGTMNWVNK
jgi:GxxExxY protein